MRAIAQLVVSRILSYFVIGFLILVLCRHLIYFLPGDPIETIIAETGANLSPTDLQALHTMSGVGTWAKGWGNSLIHHRPVSDLVAQAWPYSFHLALLSFAIALVIGIGGGIVGSIPWEFSDSRFRRIGLALRVFLKKASLISAAIPIPWIGPMALWLFCVRFPIFDLSIDPARPLLLLPALLLGGCSGLFWIRVLMGLADQTLERGKLPGGALSYWSFGKSVLRIAWQRGVRPHLGLMAAYGGSQWGQLISGALVVEMIFQRPGLGSIMMESLFARDYPLFQGSLAWSALFSLAGMGIGLLARDLLDRNVPTLTILKPVSTHTIGRHET